MYVIMFLGRTSIVYGAFAAIPIIMMWLQWTCLLILIGAELSFAIQNNEQFEYEKDLETMSRRYKDFLTLYLLHCIILRFENDQKPYTAVELAHENNVPIRLVTNLRVYRAGRRPDLPAGTRHPQDDCRHGYRPNRQAGL